MSRSPVSNVHVALTVVRDCPTVGAKHSRRQSFTLWRTIPTLWALTSFSRALILFALIPQRNEDDALADYRVGNLLTDFNGYFKTPTPPLFDYIYTDQLSLLVGPAMSGKSWFSLWTAMKLREEGISSLIISTETGRKSEWYWRAQHLAKMFPDSDVPLFYAPMPQGGLGTPEGVAGLLDGVGSHKHDYVILDSVSSATGAPPSNEEANKLLSGLEDILSHVGASGALCLGHNTLGSQERPSEQGQARNRQMGGQTYEGQFGVVIGFNKTPKARDKKNKTYRTLTIRSNAVGNSTIDVEMQFIEERGLGWLVGVDRTGETVATLLERVFTAEDPNRRGLDYRTVADHPMLTPKRLASTATDWADTVRATLNRSESFDNVGSGLYRLSAAR